MYTAAVVDEPSEVESNILLYVAVGTGSGLLFLAATTGILVAVVVVLVWKRCQSESPSNLYDVVHEDNNTQKVYCCVYAYLYM